MEPSPESFIDPALLGTPTSTPPTDSICSSNTGEHSASLDVSPNVESEKLDRPTQAINESTWLQHDGDAEAEEGETSRHNQKDAGKGKEIQQGPRAIPRTNPQPRSEQRQRVIHTYPTSPSLGSETRERPRCRVADSKTLLKRSLNACGGRRTASSAIKKLDCIYRDLRSRTMKLRELLRRFENRDTLVHLWNNTANDLLGLIKVLQKSSQRPDGLKVIEKLTQSWCHAWIEIDTIYHWLLSFNSTGHQARADLLRNVTALAKRLRAARDKLRAIIPDLEGFLDRLETSAKRVCRTSISGDASPTV